LGSSICFYETNATLLVRWLWRRRVGVVQCVSPTSRNATPGRRNDLQCETERCLCRTTYLHGSSIGIPSHDIFNSCSLARLQSHTLDRTTTMAPQTPLTPVHFFSHGSTMMLGEESQSATYWKECGDVALSNGIEHVVMMVNLPPSIQTPI